MMPLMSSIQDFYLFFIVRNECAVIFVVAAAAAAAAAVTLDCSDAASAATETGSGLSGAN